MFNISFETVVRLDIRTLTLRFLQVKQPPRDF